VLFENLYYYKIITYKVLFKAEEKLHKKEALAFASASFFNQQRPIPSGIIPSGSLMFAALTAIFACRTRDIATEIILQSSA